MARPLRGGGRLWVQHVRLPARPRSPGILLRLGSVPVAAGGPLAQAQPQGVGAAEFGLDFIQERIQVFRHLEQARAGFHGDAGARRARPPVCVPCACANRPPPRDASRRGADVLALAAGQGSWVGARVCSRGWVPWEQPVPAALPAASAQPVDLSRVSSLPLRCLTPKPGLTPRPVPTPGLFCGCKCL